jgi:N-acetylglucosamine-6-phosphate deacetylase
VIGGVPITRQGDAAITDDGALAGSVTSIDRAVRNLVEWTGCLVATPWSR